MLALVSFTDNSLVMYDNRMKNPIQDFPRTSDSHDGMVKSILISNDHSVAITGGTDATVKVWDLASRKVIQTYGGDEENK